MWLHTVFKSGFSILKNHFPHPCTWYIICNNKYFTKRMEAWQGGKTLEKKTERSELWSRPLHKQIIC